MILLHYRQSFQCFYIELRVIFHAEQYIVNIAPLQMHLLVVNQFFKSSYYSTEDHNCPFCSKCYYIGLVALFLSSHRTLSPHPGMLTEGP